MFFTLMPSNIDDFSKSFLCIEDAREWSLAQLEEVGCLEQDYILLEHSKDCSQPIKKIVSAIMTGERLELPVILVRDNRIKLPENLPKSFCIGIQTSGTTGPPKLIFHALSSIKPEKILSQYNKWIQAYHPMTFAGMQVTLQAIYSGATLISSNRGSLNQLADDAVRYKATAMSLTPSQFKFMSMCWKEALPPLKHLTFGGETCDNSCLSLAKRLFPQTKIRHIYASTELGVLFSISDKKPGFPVSIIENNQSKVPLKVKNGELIAFLEGTEVPTGDYVSLEGDRYLFAGRKDFIINVAGEKVNLLEVEEIILSFKSVEDCRTYQKNNVLTGSLVGLEAVVHDKNLFYRELEAAFINLPASHKPRLISLKSNIALASTGKKVRVNE